MASSIQRFDSDLLRQVVTIAAIVGTLGINVSSNLFPLNGLSIGEISNTLFANVLITPANYAFAIWGVIYLGLMSLGIYQLLPSQRRNPDLRQIGYWLAFACVAQAIWVFLFLLRLFGWSVVAMLGILLPLIVIYLRLGIGRRRLSRQEQWLIQIPISIYLGWITVATVVNVATALYSLNWNRWGLSDPIWTILMILVSGAIAAVIALKRQDIAFTLVSIWALVAIAVRQLANPLIVAVAGGVAFILLLLILFTRAKAASQLDRP